MKIQIICRGSSDDGLGHLFRSKTFAKAASNQHNVEIIAIVPEDLKNLFSSLACPVHFIREDSSAIQHVNNFNPEIIVFDLIEFDQSVFNLCKANTRLTVSISPIFEHMSKIDMLFARAKSSKMYSNVHCFYGLEYAIFSDHCTVISDQSFKRNLQSPSLPIAICMGGADAGNKTLLVLDSIVNLDCKTIIWVLLGEGYSHSYNKLVDCTRHNNLHEIILAKSNRSMWRIMGNCVLAILSGGLTTIESVYARIPSINIFDKKEHIEVMPEEFFNLGVCLNGGLFSDESLSKVNELVLEYNNNRHLLLDVRSRCRDLVDERGSERVINKIQEFCKN